VLMEGVRRVDEWPMIRKSIPDLDIVFRRTVDLDLPGEGLESGSKQAKKRNKIGDNERKVYKLVDGRHSVRQLVELSLLGEFETCKALYNLRNNKSIRRAAGDVDDDDHEPLSAQLPGMLLRSVIGALFTLVVIAVVGAALFAGMQATGRGPNVTRFKAPIESRMEKQLLAGTQRARLARVLEAYAFRRGNYPEKLEELLVDRSIEAIDLSYPWGERYFYERLPERGYVLLDPKR